jgi:hypothetical protein
MKMYIIKTKFALADCVQLALGCLRRVLRRIFGPKRKEVVRAWRRLHKEELHKMYPSPNMIMVMKSQKMR